MDGTIIVTGCAVGLGLHVVKNLLARPGAASYHYIFTMRPSSSTPTKPLQDLVSQFNKMQESSMSKASATIKSIDMGDLDSVRSFAADIISLVSSSKLPPIKALILNAGISWRAQNGPVPAGPKTDVEAHFQINYLANLTLSLLLLRSLNKSNGRIVYLSSWAHDSAFHINSMYKPEPILWKDDACEQVSMVSKWPKEKEDEVPLGGGRRYGASKFWQIMGMTELQKRLGADPELANISVVGIDPGGNLQTEIARYNTASDRFFMTVLGWYVTVFAQFVWPNGLWRKESKTANDIVSAGLDAKPAGQDPKGLYLNGSEIGVVAPEAKDEVKQGKLWTASLKLAGLTQQDTALKL